MNSKTCGSCARGDCALVGLVESCESWTDDEGTPPRTDSDLTIGYRAGQEDTKATRLLCEIVRLSEIADETGDYDDLDAVTDAIDAARDAGFGSAEPALDPTGTAALEYRIEKLLRENQALAEQFVRLRRIEEAAKAVVAAQDAIESHCGKLISGETEQDETEELSTIRIMAIEDLREVLA